MVQNLHKRRYSLFIFIIIVLASGWFGVFVDTKLAEQPEGNSLGMGLWLVLPFLAVIVIRLITRDWSDFGLKPRFRGNGLWYAAALGIYPAIMIVTVGLALLFSGASLSDTKLSSVVSLIAVSLAGNLLKNIFEEFSWRGYLTPKLIEQKLNDWLIYLISGLVWALWHAPYYFVFLPDDYFESLSRLGFLLTGCVLMTVWTVMYVEIYRLTKSVWPCILLHATEDAFPTLFIMVSGIVTFTKTADFWLNSITGVITTVLFLIIGLTLRAIRIKKKQAAGAAMA